MKKQDVKIGSFYSTNEGVVRVVADALTPGHFLCWEKDGQEPITLPARALVCWVPDPEPVVTDLAALAGSAPTNAKLYWASRDTRWDVYPQRQPVVLAAHNWEGWYLPLPNGKWFKCPVSYVPGRAVDLTTDRGEWRQVGTLHYFHVV